MDALFQFLKEIWNGALPWIFIPPWEMGVRVRAGKHISVLGPGAHWRIPLLDIVETQNVKMQIINLPNQSMRTKDDKSIAISCALAYSISDVLKNWTEVYNHDDSMINLTMGLVADFISKHTWVECEIDLIQNRVSAAVRREAKKWGIEVDHIYVTDLCQSRAIRLLQEQSYKTVGSGG